MGRRAGKTRIRSSFFFGTARPVGAGISRFPVRIVYVRVAVTPLDMRPCTSCSTGSRGHSSRAIVPPDVTQCNGFLPRVSPTQAPNSDACGVPTSLHHPPCVALSLSGVLACSHCERNPCLPQPAVFSGVAAGCSFLHRWVVIGFAAIRETVTRQKSKRKSSQ